jgi:TonB family protein
MKRLFLVLALAFTVQAQAQALAQEEDELPTPEAFAKDCLDSMVFFVQQITEVLRKAEANPDDLNPQLKEDMNTAATRFNIKDETCKAIAEILGEDYVTQLSKVSEGPEVKLAKYKMLKVIEEIALQDTLDSPEQNQPSLNTSRDAYVLAIRQKVERNWIKPSGSGNMSSCEVLVVQGPGGIILDVDFGHCDGSTATYRASIENAVYKAEPLPSPGDPELFESQLVFFFNPEESSATAIQKSSTRERSADEIEGVFQKNKGGVFNIYNRALRKNPSLAGQVIIELTISPEGQVTAAKVLSSELGDEALEQKLIAKIMRFKFTKADVPEITVTYPIDFLPS